MVVEDWRQANYHACGGNCKHNDQSIDSVYTAGHLLRGFIKKIKAQIAGIRPTSCTHLSVVWLLAQRQKNMNAQKGCQWVIYEITWCQRSNAQAPKPFTKTAQCILYAMRFLPKPFSVV